MQLFDLSHYYLLQGIYDGVASVFDNDSTLLDTVVGSYITLGNTTEQGERLSVAEEGEGTSVFSSE